jgi:FAD binding domain in molybdopterin dehydrogenase.
MLRAWNFMYTINPAPFDYLPVQSLDEAVKLLHEYGESAKVVAGGQSCCF